MLAKMFTVKRWRLRVTGQVDGPGAHSARVEMTILDGTGAKPYILRVEIVGYAM